MPSAKSLQIIIQIRQKPLWKKILLFPVAMQRHYKLFRKHMPIYKAIYGAWLMAGLSIRKKYK